MSELSPGVAIAGGREAQDPQPNLWLGRILFLTCAFPFIGLPGMSFDSQPWALAVALLVLTLAAVTGRLVLERDTLLLLAAVVLIVALCAIDLFAARRLRVDNVGSAARLLFGVVSLPAIATAAYLLRYRLEWRLLVGAYLTWFVVAVIQLRAPGFGSAFLPRVSTSATRGVVSLAPEPDMYGRAVITMTTLAFLLFLAGRLRRRTLLWLVLGSVAQVLFLSRAMTSAIFMMCVGAAVLFASSRRTSSRVAMLVAFGVTCGIVIWAGMQLMAQARVFLLLRALARNPELWTQQGGFVLRAFNPLLSIQVGLADTFGRGVGVASTPTPGQSVVLWPLGVTMGLPERAHGGLIGLVYSAGLLGLLYVLGFYHALLRALRRIVPAGDHAVVLAGIAVFTVVLFFDQSLANGMNAYTFGLVLLLARSTHPSSAPMHAAEDRA